MLSNQLSSRLGIVANFPKAPTGQYYQLISLGDLRHTTGAALNLLVDAYFQCVKKQGDGYSPLGSPFMRSINLHQAASLQVGTLLYDDGTSYLSSQLAVSDSLDFQLGPGVCMANTKLEVVLPGLRFRKSYLALRHFISDPILRSLQQLPVSTLTAPSGEIVIIPQFELARAFYLWAGAKFIDFLFHPTRTSHICDPIQAPNSTNKLTGKVLIRPSSVDAGNVFDLDTRFSPEQVLLLAEMRFSSPFRRAIEQACAQQALGFSKGTTTPLSLELALSREVAVRANGIRFSHRDQVYFWVCSIYQRGNYFCFDHLHYTTLVDHRHQGQLAAGASPVEQPQEGLVTHLGLQNQPRQDSNQQGSSAYGGQEVLLPSGEKLDLPTVQRNAKAVKQALYGRRRRHRQGLPEVLTQRPGGDDLSIAKVNFRPDWESLDSLEYFETIVAEFRRSGYIVSRLQINNPTSAFGRGFSVPKDTVAGSAPYQVGIACSQKPVGDRSVYCYFFHVLYSRSKRSAFVYRTDLAPLKTNQLNWLLKEIRRWKDDWLETRKEYKRVVKEQAASLLQEGIRLPLTLNARNRKGPLQVVELCLGEFEKELRI